ncbi:MAG: hypothetical protein SNH63_01515 [Rikenellaceae bacterium]
MKICKFLAAICIALSCVNISLAKAKEQVVVISSVAELAEAAKGSKGNIKMEPGVYQISDYLTSEVIENARAADALGRKAMLLFSGDKNIFDLTGVVLEIDTRLLAAFKASINEIQITGSGNLIKGLTVNDIGNYPPTGKGARSFVVTGDNNTIDGVTLNMNGSSPFGYGDLLGKGDAHVTSLKKHSGMLIEGRAVSILNCSIYSQSFGHLFFVQGGRDVYFENCYAEAQVRATDDMLAEREGVAFDNDFRAVYSNSDNQKVITGGYVKSLSECGFRNYGSGGPDKNRTGKITIVNCRAKNTRIGFAFTRMADDIEIVGCEAQGCEVGYSLAGVKVSQSRGDAEYGPLFYILKSGVASEVELALMSAQSTSTVHSIAHIAGDGHSVWLSEYGGERRESALPIVIGQSNPSANNGYTPTREVPASGVSLVNDTQMPVVLNQTTSSCSVASLGEVRDLGLRNKVASTSK